MMRIVLLGIYCLLLFSPLLAKSPAEQDVSSLWITVGNHYGNKDYGQALESLLQISWRSQGCSNEQERDNYVRSTLMAAMCYENLKQSEEAFNLCEQLMKKNLASGEQAADLHQLYVSCGYSKALSLILADKYVESREWLSRVEPYADDKMRSSIVSKKAMSWYLEGSQYIMKSQFNQAIPCMTQAVSLYRESGESDSEIKALLQLGYLSKESFDIFKALAYYDQAFQLARGSEGDALLIPILWEQSRFCEQIGDMEKSASYDMMMDSLMAHSDDVNARIEYYADRGKQAVENGQLRLAESWYQLRGECIKNLVDSDSNTAATKYKHYLDLSDLYFQSGRYHEALESMEKCNETLKSIPDYIASQDYYAQGRLADVYGMMGDSINCFTCIDKMFMAHAQLKDPLGIEYLYMTRARNHSAFNNYESALKDYQEVDSMLATRYGALDGDKVKVLALMAKMEMKLGHFEDGVRHYRQYAESVKALWGENSLLYAKALVYLANAEGFAGQEEAGSQHYVLAVEKMKRLIHHRMPYYTSSKREGFWEPISEVVRNMTPYAVESGQLQTPFTESCYEGLMISKAFLLTSAQSTFDLIKRHGTAEELKEYTTIAAMKAQIVEMEKDYPAHRDSILHLTTQADVLEKRLMGTCREYGDMTSFLDTGYRQIQQHLGENDVLIDFSDYCVEGKGREYVAYLISKTQPYPLLRVLFDEDTVSFIKALYIDMYYQEPFAGEIRRLLWEPFKQYVQEGSTVYYVPSQFLFQLAIESLPLEDGTLLGDHFRFIRLSSARGITVVNDVLSLDTDSVAHCDAILYGGLTYDIIDDVIKEESTRHGDIPVMYAAANEVARGDNAFRELPMSKVEIDSIASILEEHGVTVESYCGDMGTEESFVMLSGNAPRILHLATHGFYYTPDEAQDVEYLHGYRDAMMLSGLVMSGGNAAWMGRELPEGVLGGIMTANDIAKLDLSHVDLVVLSACNTARGEVTPEGLYGLQRAFKNAGAGTVVMSLWRVNDDVGTTFMIEFFKNLADPAVGWNKREAFNMAKSHIRYNTEYSEPYYWAGFIMLD